MAQSYTDINVYQQNLEASKLVDEVSTTEFYVGESNNTNSRGKDNWRIKKIWQVGTVWNFGFPNGNQGYVFNWDDRDVYTYNI